MLNKLRRTDNTEYDKVEYINRKVLAGVGGSTKNAAVNRGMQFNDYSLLTITVFGVCILSIVGTFAMYTDIRWCK